MKWKMTHYSLLFLLHQPCYSQQQHVWISHATANSNMFGSAMLQSTATCLDQPCYKQHVWISHATANSNMFGSAMLQPTATWLDQPCYNQQQHVWISHATTNSNLFGSAILQPTAICLDGLNCWDGDSTSSSTNLKTSFRSNNATIRKWQEECQLGNLSRHIVWYRVS